MAEQSQMGEIGRSPKDTALSYIKYHDVAKASGKVGKMDKDQIPLGPPHGVWRESEISAATAYERVIAKLDDNAVRRAMEDLRPLAYDMARVYRYAALIGEVGLGGKLLFHDFSYPSGAGVMEKIGVHAIELGKGVAGAGLVALFRPVEWGAARLADVGGLITAEAVAPIVNNLLKGGQNPSEIPAPKPA